MKRFLQSPLCWCLGAIGLVIGFGMKPEAPASAQGTPALPAIEKVKHTAYVETLADKVNFKMLPIPGGTYLMGSPASEKGRVADEGPQHPVAIQPFWMGECEVTWDEYDYFWSKRPGGPPP